METEQSYIMKALEILRNVNLNKSTICDIVGRLDIGQHNRSTLLILINGFQNYFPVGIVIDYSKGYLQQDLEPFKFKESYITNN